MGASSSTCSSSSTTATHGGKYDLFVNFRGKDIRDRFKSHFCKALSREKIDFFVDDNLNRGDELWPALSKAIEDSRISVVIFSKDYASSKWCLRELVKILECKETNGQIVIPVFYHVDTSHVSKQTGSFEDAFVNNHGNVSEDEKQEWRAALTKASKLAGFNSSSIRPESKLLDKIIKDVLKKLKDISPSSNDSKSLIGINLRVERVKSLLCIGKSNFEIVGIWGMGGIGKTTIADAVFNQICSEFDCRHFIANVREESKRPNGLHRLQKKVLSKILEENYVDFGTPSISQYSRDKLKCIKVLIVLDDVNTLKQLETLTEGLDGFGPGSRIIITTRERHVLYDYGVNKIYEVEAFDNHEAHQLFCKHAFKLDNPRNELMVFIDKVVNYAKGNPLALKVVGSSSQHLKTPEDWKSALNKLNKILDPKILNILKISYDGLDKEEKDIFLDIACFFKGQGKDFVTTILDGCYFAAQMGLSSLVDKCLVTISDGIINMHDLLQEMGHELVCQESLHNPGKRSRLHNHEDVCLVLRRNMGSEMVKGICLDMSKMKNIQVNPQVFEKMWNLRFLKFYNATEHTSKLCDPSYLPDELRYLCWDGYPSKALPSSFSPENLVELELSNSNLEQLWEGKMDAPKLKRIKFFNSRHLTKIPEFSNAPHLEYIDLDHCKNLLESGSTLQHFNNLRYLSLCHCQKLRSFPEIAGNIETIDLSDTVIEEIPSSLGSLTKLADLYLKGTAIVEIPSSIGSPTNLTNLFFSNCKRLKHISPNICKLKSLLTLSFKGCSNLETFPEISEIMESLTQLDLSGTAIKELPPSIENLKWLWTLELSNCENLEKLPSSICNLRSLGDLYASNCPKLDKLPENLGNLKSLWRLDADRTAIDQLPSSLTSLENLEELDCSGCRGLTLPPMSGLLRSLRELILVDCNMTEIPEDIGCLSSLEELYLSGNDFESLPKSIKQLSSLWLLCLSKCNMLQSLPELPLGLSRLIAMDCKQLQSLPDAYHFADSAIECRSHRTTLAYNFVNCVTLDKKVCNNVFKESVLKIQREKGHEQKVFNFNICFPGRDTPSWFSYQSFGSSVNIQLPLDSWGNRKLVGFALCVVLEFEERLIDYECDVCVNCKCYYKIKYGDRLLMDNTICNEYSIDRYPRHSKKISIELDHVVLSYYEFADLVKLSTDDYTIFSLQFKFLSSDNCKPNISNEIFDATNQDFAETSGSGRGRSDDHEEGLEPNPKRICT
ncbi:hypothetical protein ACOSQ2_009404 [Xanthoceras sorbifolium]